MSIKIENLTHIYMPKTPFEKKALDDVNLYIEDGEFIALIGHTGSGKSTLIQHLNGLLEPSSGKIIVDEALDDVNLYIEDGEFIALIGHTGSGKSTLIQHLNGLLEPSSGKIIVDDIDITEKGVKLSDIRKKVGLVFQYPEYQLFEETIEKDIAFGPTNLGLGQEEILVRVKRAMEMVGLDYDKYKDVSPFELSGGQKRRVAIAGVIAMEPKVLILDEPTAGLDPKLDYDKYKDVSPFELSGGQKRRVAIAGVIAMEPKVLILDEPTAGLDPKGREDILAQIKKLHDEYKMTIILVSHSMEDVGKLAKRIVVMNHGKVALQGEPKDVFKEIDTLEEIGLGVPQVTYLMRELKRRGFNVSDEVFTVEQGKEELLKIFVNDKKSNMGEK